MLIYKHYSRNGVMNKSTNVKGNPLYNKIKVMANKHRFNILQITQKEKPSIAELSSKLKLAYTKTSDYVTILEKQDLLEKIKEGKEVKIKSKVIIKESVIEFLD